MATRDDKMQALAFVQHYLSRRRDSAPNICTPSILQHLYKKTNGFVDERNHLLFKIKYNGVCDWKPHYPDKDVERANFCCLTEQVNARSKLRSVEKKIYSSHALKIIMENGDTWQSLLMPGRTSENERRALNMIMEKYNKVKEAIYRGDRYLAVSKKMEQLNATMNMHIQNRRTVTRKSDPELQKWQTEFDQHRAEFYDLRIEQRIVQVLDQTDDPDWEEALMWVCYWKCVPATVKTWIIEYEKLRGDFWVFWKSDTLKYGFRFSNQKHKHRNIDTFPSETILASYFLPPVSKELSFIEADKFYVDYPKPKKFEFVVCQNTYSDLYGRDFNDFREKSSDTDSNPDFESDAAIEVSHVFHEWEEETDSDTEHDDSLAIQNGPDTAT